MKKQPHPRVVVGGGGCTVYLSCRFVFFGTRVRSSDSALNFGHPHFFFQSTTKLLVGAYNEENEVKGVLAQRLGAQQLGRLQVTPRRNSAGGRQLRSEGGMLAARHYPFFCSSVSVRRFVRIEMREVGATSNENLGASAVCVCGS